MMIRYNCIALFFVFAALASPCHARTGTQSSRASIPQTAIKEAAAKCDVPFGPETAEALPQLPVLTLYQDQRNHSPWSRRPGLQIQGLETRSSAEFRTLVCIRASQVKVGEYRSETSLGPDAFRVKWEIQLLRWSDGAVLGGKVLLGSDPPEHHAGPISAVGRAPTVAQYTAWLRSRLFAVLLPITKLQVQLPEGSGWKVSPLEDRDRLENPGGIMATVSIQQSSTHRECTDILQAVAASSGGKVVMVPDYVETYWDVRALEVGEMTSVCHDFPHENVIVLLGPLDKVKKDSETIRRLLREIRRAVLRQLHEQNQRTSQNPGP